MGRYMRSTNPRQSLMHYDNKVSFMQWFSRNIYWTKEWICYSISLSSTHFYPAAGTEVHYI